jgi:small-conductance mechanosensitive channel
MNRLESLSLHHFYGNSARDWLIAGVVAVILFALFIVVRRVLIVRLGEVATRTGIESDQAIVDLLKRTKWPFLLAVALFVATRWITFQDSTDFERVRQLFELILIVQVGLWAAGVVTFFTDRSVARRERGEDRFGVTAIRMLGICAKFACWLVVLLSALELVFGKTASSLVTGIGVGGVALALAVQNILGDLLATLAIAFDRPFDVGDTIAIDQITGTVEYIGLKTTRIRSVMGEEVIVGNGDLIKSRLRNYRRMTERRVMLLLDLNPDTSPDVIQRVPGMLREIIGAQTGVRFERSHFAALTDAALRIETVYFVLDRDYTRYMDAQQAVTLEVVRRFERDGIRLAFPTRSEYVDPAGPAAKPGATPSPAVTAGASG